MNTTKLLCLATGILFLAGCQSTPGSRVRGQVNSSQQEELRQASLDWDNIFNAGDAAKLAALYADDAVSMPPNSPTIRGRKAIQAEFENFFASNVTRHETKVETILMEGDLAIESASYRLTFKPRIGGTETVESGRHLECRRKLDGKWKIVLEIWNFESPATK